MIQNGVVSGGGEKKFNITQNGTYQLFPNDAFAGEILTSTSIEKPGGLECYDGTGYARCSDWN